MSLTIEYSTNEEINRLGKCTVMSSAIFSSTVDQTDRLQNTIGCCMKTHSY